MSGLIAKISLKNFMSHDKWELEFKKDIIFIGGENGAGKSAILAAMSLCFGGNARSTNRSTAVGSFVQRERAQAVISITIRNTGTDAFERELYGDTLTIERIISDKGSSQFKIRDQQGKVVPGSGRDILDQIIDRFNIQVGNPCAVLDQDTSKSFLVKATPEQKYEFFLRGTQLEKMKNYLNSIELKISEFRERLHKKGLLIPEMKRKMKRLGDELETVSLWHKKKEALTELKLKILWSYVVEYEKKMEKLEEDISSCHENLKKAEEKKGTYLKEKQMLDGEVKEVDDKTNTIGAEIDEIKKEIAVHQGRQKTGSKELQKYASQIQAVDLNVKQLKTRKKNFEEQLKGLKDTQAEEIKAIQDKKDKQIASLEAKVAEKEARLREVKAVVDSKQHEMTTASKQSVELESELDGVVREVKQIEGFIERFKRTAQNRASAFGAHTDAIQKLIQTHHKRFGKTPLGPIGFYLSVPETKWARAVEMCIGQVLSNYCVDSLKDQDEFFKLLREKNIPTDKINVIVSPYTTERYVTPELPDPSLVTVISKINSDQPHILNVLIDQKKAERTFLAETQDDAMRVMDNKRLRQLIQGLQTVDCEGVHYTAQGDSATFMDHSGMLRPVTLADSQSQITEYEERLKVKKLDLKTATENRNRQAPKVKTLKDEVAHQRKLALQLSKAIDEMNEDIKSIQSEPLPVDNSGSRKDWENNIAEVERDIEENNEKKAQLQQALDQAQSALSPFEQQINQLTKKLNLKMKEAHANEERLVKIAGWQSSNKEKNEQVVTITNQLMALLEAKTKEHAEIKEVTDSKIAELQAEGQERIRLNKNETTTALQSLQRTLQKQIDEQAKTQRDISEILPEFVKAKKAVSDIEDEMSTLQAISQRCDASYDKRKDLYVELLKNLTKRIKAAFRHNLANKGFEGRITVDHTERKLNFEITPNNKATQSDTSSLSGGEKSYSTVSFLMALWDVMENSVCAMDEFDVFMDMSARTKSIEMLTEMALSHPKRQFIFISPQSMSGVPVNDAIQMVVLAAPTRGRGQ